MSIKTNIFPVMLLLGLIGACTTQTSKEESKPEDERVTINLDHFNHLYQEVTIDGDTMGVVHIYSEYPDYEYAIEPKEGYTCVDDVARSMVMLAEYSKSIADTPQINRQIRNMTKFLLYMQNENGYFNNFMWKDLSINTTYQTTVAELNWWSLRAFWALEEVLPIIKTDSALAKRTELALDRLVDNLIRDLNELPETFDTVNTLSVPNWLPNQYAADQASVLILGLLPYYERTGDKKSLELLHKMAQGIMQMQKGDNNNFPYGAFMSWTNLWHAWGNSQAYAMLTAGTRLDKQEYIKSGLKEVDHFYSYLLENGFLAAFWIEKKDEHFVETKREEFSRIAYGIRPMVWASMQAYEITGDNKYLDLAGELASWFQGNNITGVKMYDEKTGRGYDGINAPDSINKNAGAESTIESLLTLLRINK